MVHVPSDCILEHIPFFVYPAGNLFACSCFCQLTSPKLSNLLSTWVGFLFRFHFRAQHSIENPPYLFLKLLLWLLLLLSLLFLFFQDSLYYFANNPKLMNSTTMPYLNSFTIYCVGILDVLLKCSEISNVFWSCNNKYVNSFEDRPTRTLA